MSDNKHPDLRESFPGLLRGAFDVSPPPGWAPLVERLLARIDAALASEDREGFRVSQIKEKFGGLRVYHNGGDAIEGFVDEAAEEASRTCDVCGQPGRMRGGGCFAVRCDGHGKA